MKNSLLSNEQKEELIALKAQYFEKMEGVKNEYKKTRELTTAFMS